jgi:hypothetical protein
LQHNPFVHALFKLNSFPIPKVILIEYKQWLMIAVYIFRQVEHLQPLTVQGIDTGNLQPSPQEKKSFWKRENSSSSAKNRPPIIPPDEQFTISRESFDSYRRSFVIGLVLQILNSCADDYTRIYQLDPQSAISPQEGLALMRVHTGKELVWMPAHRRRG